MLTEPDDPVIDPCAGSCVTGEVCERSQRRWTCIERHEDYCLSAVGRFVRGPSETARAATNPDDPSNFYRVPRPGTRTRATDCSRTAAGNAPPEPSLSRVRILSEAKAGPRDQYELVTQSALPDMRGPPPGPASPFGRLVAFEDDRP